MKTKTVDTIEMGYAILIDQNGKFVEIELYDNENRRLRIEMSIPIEHFAKALSRLVGQRCSVDFHNIDTFNKKAVNETIIFEIEKCADRDEAKKKAQSYAEPDEFIDLSFSSQGSFFFKDGKYYAKTYKTKFVDRT